MIKRMREGVYLIESDRHFPYECKAYSSIVLQTALALNKDLVGWVNVGDLLDNPQCSTHLKDPRNMKDLEEDIESINGHLDDIEAAIPKGATVDLLEGNHEDRLRRYVLSNAPKVIGMVSTIPKEYGLAERNRRAKCKWQWHRLADWRSLQVGDCVIHHGHYFDKSTAVSNLTRYCSRGVSFLQGHTHRSQIAYNDHFFSATIGHGSDEESHLPTPNDHRKAFALLTVYKGKSYIELYTVDEGSAIVRGKVIRG